MVWHLDVGSSLPGAEVGTKGAIVHRLMWHVSWVNTVVIQVGPYLLRVWVDKKFFTIVREELEK